MIIMKPQPGLFWNMDDAQPIEPLRPVGSMFKISQ